MVILIIIVLTVLIIGFVGWATAQGNGDDNEYLQLYEDYRMFKQHKQCKDPCKACMFPCKAYKRLNKKLNSMK